MTFSDSDRLKYFVHLCKAHPIHVALDHNGKWSIHSDYGDITFSEGFDAYEAAIDAAITHGLIRIGRLICS